MFNKISPEILIIGILLLAVGVGIFFLPAPRTEVAARTTPYQEIVNPSGFVNTEQITLGELIGKKVILVDFMTYSCINCQRTFPYLNAWYEAYKDEGLEIVGIHTPEFAFERDRDNVIEAAAEFGLQFPIVLDNEYATWAAYKNRYWPRKYLIDINGNIVYDHIGEGAYDETEEKIVELLNERKRVLGEAGIVTSMNGTPSDVPIVDFSKVRTPETYLGRERMQYLVNQHTASCESGACAYTFSSGTFNGYELSGVWRLDDEYARLESAPGAIRISFEAAKVNLVAGGNTRVEVYVDGALHKEFTITDHVLYNLVDIPEYGKHILEVRFLDAGVEAFAFTFG